jgi:hypothetical protein
MDLARECAVNMRSNVTQTSREVEHLTTYARMFSDRDEMRALRII